MIVKLVVNGKPFEAEGPLTVADLLRALEMHAKPVAVEVNRDIVPRQQHAQHKLGEGDQIEVVSLVGGG